MLHCIAGCSWHTLSLRLFLQAEDRVSFGRTVLITRLRHCPLIVPALHGKTSLRSVPRMAMGSMNEPPWRTSTPAVRVRKAEPDL